MQPNAKELAEIDAGRTPPHVSTRLPLERAARAREISQGGHTRGKIVLEVVAPPN